MNKGQFIKIKAAREYVQSAINYYDDGKIVLVKTELVKALKELELK